MWKDEPLQRGMQKCKKKKKNRDKAKITSKKKGSQQSRARRRIQGQQDGSRISDSVNIRYLNFNSARSVIFTKFVSITSQERTQIIYKIDPRGDGNLMPFRVFKILFPKSTVPELHTTKITQLC